jgi:hypothetical protein
VTSSKNHSVIARYFKTNLAVVEVRNGESQDDAWRRYLADHPDCAGVNVKIFHYEGPSPLKKASGAAPRLQGQKHIS